MKKQRCRSASRLGSRLKIAWYATLGQEWEFSLKNRKIGNQNRCDFLPLAISRHSGISKNTIFMSGFGLVWSGCAFETCEKIYQFSVLVYNRSKIGQNRKYICLYRPRSGKVGQMYLPMSMTNVFYPKIMWISADFYYFSQFLYFCGSVHYLCMVGKV